MPSMFKVRVTSSEKITFQLSQTSTVLNSFRTEVCALLFAVESTSRRMFHLVVDAIDEAISQAMDRVTSKVTWCC